MAAPGALIPSAPTLRHRLRLARLRAQEGVEVAGIPLLGRDVTIRVGAGGRLLLGDQSSLGDGTNIHVHPGATVEIGEGAVLGERCRIVAVAGATVGRRALLGDGVVLTDFSPRAADPERPTREQGLTAEPIAVGAGARVGHGAGLLRGAAVEPGGEVPPHAVLGTP